MSGGGYASIFRNRIRSIIRVEPSVLLDGDFGSYEDCLSDGDMGIESGEVASVWCQSFSSLECREGGSKFVEKVGARAMDVGGRVAPKEDLLETKHIGCRSMARNELQERVQYLATPTVQGHDAHVLTSRR